MNYLENAFVGCLLGGAIGDALGYAVEFQREEQIQAKYGFVKTFVSQPLISDDTQMSLYTAVAMEHALGHTPDHDPRKTEMLARAYLRWYEGQIGEFHGVYPSFLRFVPYLNQQRSPGNTCMGALKHYSQTNVYPTIENPINPSKGCGGVMRVAPIGLIMGKLTEEGGDFPLVETIRFGAEASAITHGHSLGYISSGYLAGLIQLIVEKRVESSLPDLAHEALQATKEVFGQDKHWNEFETIMDKAFALALEEKPELDAIPELGEGWVGEEAIAIALYCCLKHPYSFGDAVAYAVNHNGDSDSTGAIAGNILGAYLGLENIRLSFPDYWKVEGCDLIAEIALDLAHDIPQRGNPQFQWWVAKYDCLAPKEAIEARWSRFRERAPR